MNPATIVTTSRLLWAPAFAYLFIMSVRNDLHPLRLWLALLFAVLIELSDAFDGPLARYRREVTDFGKVFDPICDGLSRQTVFLAFLLADIIPLWMFLVFMYRDAIMSFLRIMCAVDGRVIAARLSGKAKAVLQALATFMVIALLLAKAHNIVHVPDMLWGRHPGFWIMLPVALFTFLSMFDYLMPNLHVLKRRMTPSGS
jgi:CDP-diacylglycerol--glycerol-3-phosphate 3-phosphatidyltransferase